MKSNIIQDPSFQQGLLALLLRDRTFLRHHAHLLSMDDFKPLEGDLDSKNRWLIAGKALDHWEKYREPIHHLLPTELKRHIREARLGEKRSDGLLKVGELLLNRTLTGARAIADRLLEFKQKALITQTIEEMVNLNASGELTSEKFLELARLSLEFDGSKKMATIDYLESLEARIERRILGGGDERYPVLFIDPFDVMVRAIAKGQLGCIVGPYKRGKSLMLLWIAIAYIIQKLNVLYITLEDSKEDVEDRLDACITNLPIKELKDRPKSLRRRFALFKRIVRGRLKVVDGTDLGLKVADIEQIWLEERENGFLADAVIIDYDDEVVPSKANKDRRQEFAQVYRDMRKFSARHHLLTWTAAQTQRGTTDLKVLSGDKLAEDISKARKVACMITMGQGEWGPDSIYLNVAAHKHDRQHIGCNIFSNKDNMAIYDRPRTLEKLKELARKAKKKGAQP